MAKYTPQNERIKRQYFTYLKEAKRHSEATVDGVAGAISRFEEYTHHKDFKTFRIEQAVAFKTNLANHQSRASGEKLSKSTLYSTLQALKGFFQWLAGQQGYKSRISYTDAEYFNLSDKETRIAKTSRTREGPTLAQIRHVLSTMPTASDIQRRDKATMAFITLTGARDSAVASLRLKHINLAEGVLYQDAREVNTKASKTITTYFFPVGEDILKLVTDWAQELYEEKLWGPNDPLFPATQVGVLPGKGFQATGIARKPWKSAAGIRAIFKKAFAEAGLPYHNPHSFRKTLALLGQQLCQTPEEYKAWSQNLGHENVLTTFTSYGNIATARQAEIIRNLALPKQDDPETKELMAKLLKKLA